MVCTGHACADEIEGAVIGRVQELATTGVQVQKLAVPQSRSRFEAPNWLPEQSFQGRRTCNLAVNPSLGRTRSPFWLGQASSELLIQVAGLECALSTHRFG